MNVPVGQNVFFLIKSVLFTHSSAQTKCLSIFLRNKCFRITKLKARHSYQHNVRKNAQSMNWNLSILGKGCHVHCIRAVILRESRNAYKSYLIIYLFLSAYFVSFGRFQFLNSVIIRNWILQKCTLEATRSWLTTRCLTWNVKAARIRQLLELYNYYLTNSVKNGFPDTLKYFMEKKLKCIDISGNRALYFNRDSILVQGSVLLCKNRQQ